MAVWRRREKIGASVGVVRVLEARDVPRLSSAEDGDVRGRALGVVAAGDGGRRGPQELSQGALDQQIVPWCALDERKAGAAALPPGDTAVEAQDLTANLLKPGADPKDIWEANNAFLEERSYFPERRLYAHGQGYDLVERPATRYDEPMKVRANMNITVHPFAGSEDIWATICDNYLVRETGDCVHLHKTPRKIIVL